MLHKSISVTSTNFTFQSCLEPVSAEMEIRHQPSSKICVQWTVSCRICQAWEGGIMLLGLYKMFRQSVPERPVHMRRLWYNVQTDGQQIIMSTTSGVPLEMEQHVGYATNRVFKFRNHLYRFGFRCFHSLQHHACYHGFRSGVMLRAPDWHIPCLRHFLNNVDQTFSYIMHGKENRSRSFFMSYIRRNAYKNKQNL